MKSLKAGSITLSTAGKWAFYFVLIGLIAGLGSVVFQLLCQVGSHFLMDQLAGYRPPAPAGEGHLFTPTQTPLNRWMLLFLPALGGIVSGWLVYTFAPEAEGHGTDAAIDAYHNRGGFIRGRIPILKTIASAITLTSGGSGGREGPIAQIGAGFGSFLATRLKLSDRQRRIMMAAGMGAGVGSIFRAPLAGALFAAEVLYRDPEFESEVIIPAGISSVVAYCVFCLFFGWGSLFDTHDYLFRNPLELGPYTVLAFVLAGAGFLYVKAFYGVKHIAHSIERIPNHIKPAIGGLLTGAIGFFFPQTLSFGYGFAQLALDNQLPTLFLLTLGFGKILTTAFSIGSGGSGGVFGPSVVIGGALGGAVGKIFHQIMPGIVTHPGAFVVVGMAGFFAGVSNTPISTIIFVSEMTNSYHLLLPGLLVCSLSYMLSRRWTIFENQVPSKINSNAHKGDFFVDILAAIRVREMTDQLRKVRLIPENMTLSDFRKIFSSSDQHYFPVVDKDNRMTGIFSINDIRGIIFDKEVGELVRMKDVANPDIIYATPSEDLNEVFKKCTIRNLHRVPVVRDDDHSVLIGMLDRREMIQFYNQKVEEIKAGHDMEGAASDGDVRLLREITVKEAMNPLPEPVGVDLRLDQLKTLIYDRGFNSFPVVNASGRLEGILSLSDLKSAFTLGDDTLTAGDIATRRVVTVTGRESLLSALAKITAGDFAILPVVERERPDELLGVISRTDIMKAINNVIVK
ncbi:MAG: chloride channel protein [Deltaproteobacteria bacterium]|nr:chloride channel protein [Deltaproteobacteria bacterium]